jgi:hypothetical protein
MKYRKIFLCLFAFLMLLLSSGCVSLVQEMSVSQDGSGSLRFAIGVDTASYARYEETIPEGLRLENLLSPLLQDEGISNVDEKVYESGDLTWQSIQIDVSDLASFLEEPQRVGPLTMIIDQRNGVYTFIQTMDIGESNFEVPGINLLDLRSAAYTVRFVSPQIIDTNGVQPSAELSEWEIPLEAFIQEDETINLEVEYALEPYDGVFIPWEVFFPYIVIGFLLAGVLAIFLVIMINTRKKEEEIPQIKF